MEIDHEILRDIDWAEAVQSADFDKTISSYQRAGIPKESITELLRTVFINGWGKGWNCHIDRAKEGLSDE